MATEAVSGPGGSYAAPSPPGGHDLEDPPLVEAWVVPDHPVTTASASNTKAYPPTAEGVGAHAISQPAPGLLVSHPAEKSGGTSLAQRDEDVYGLSLRRKPTQMGE